MKKYKFIVGQPPIDISAQEVSKLKTQVDLAEILKIVMFFVSIYIAYVAFTATSGYMHNTMYSSGTTFENLDHLDVLLIVCSSAAMAIGTWWGLTHATRQYYAHLCAKLSDISTVVEEKQLERLLSLVKKYPEIASWCSSITEKRDIVGGEYKAMLKYDTTASHEAMRLEREKQLNIKLDEIRFTANQQHVNKDA